MKKILLSTLAIACALSIALIYSCKKKDDSTTTTTTTPGNTTPLNVNDQTFNDDANYYKSENDQVSTDVNTDLSNYSSLQARIAQGGVGFQTGYAHPCGCTNPDTSNLRSNPPTIVYHFDGTTNCWGRRRSGSIKVQLTSGNHWSDTGAVLTFSTTDYTVTRIYDNKSITFNGTKTLKNVNGSGLLQWLAFFTQKGTIKLQERTDSMYVTFNGGLHAIWNTAYTNEWSYDTATKVIYFKANGDTSIGSYSNVYAWGTDRFNQQFYSHIGVGNPIICNSVCGYIEPMSGQVIHNVDSASLTINLGVNQNGTNYSGNGCPWGFNVAWQFPHSNDTANFQYW